jgi:DNA-binding NtrC family response regulator
MSAAISLSKSEIRILLIEDEDDLRDALEVILGHAGYLVTSVANGEAALEQARGGEFAMAVTDYRMPGLDGLETMRRLKEMDPSLRFLVVTAYATPDIEDEFRRLGAFAQIRKPFELSELLALLDKALQPA